MNYMGIVFYVGVNGVLRVNKGGFHYPVEGMSEAPNRKIFIEEAWILEEDINPFINPNWVDGYKPFSGTQLFTRNKKIS